MQGIGLLLVSLLLLFSAETMQAAYQAAQVFVAKVLPALFPMMVLGSLMGSRMPAAFSRTGAGIFQIMFGFCAGSPASVRQLSTLDQRQNFSPWDYRTLLCISGVMSPMFFTGTLASLVGSRSAWLMLLCHWLSALLTGGVCWAMGKVSMRRGKRYCSHKDSQKTNWQLPRKSIDRPAHDPVDQLPGESHSKTTITPSTTPLPLPAALTNAINSAALAQLSVLGAMMLFSIIAAVGKALLGHLFPALVATHGFLLATAWSLLEIGGGTLALLDTTPHAPLWLLCALCSFGGLSIWLQNLLFLDQKIRPAELLGWRMLHGVIAGIVCSCLSRWLGIVALATQPTVAGAFSAPSATGVLLTGIPGWLPLLLLVILAVHRRRVHPSS